MPTLTMYPAALSARSIRQSTGIYRSPVVYCDVGLINTFRPPFGGRYAVFEEFWLAECVTGVARRVLHLYNVEMGVVKNVPFVSVSCIPAKKKRQRSGLGSAQLAVVLFPQTASRHFRFTNMSSLHDHIIHYCRLEFLSSFKQNGRAGTGTCTLNVLHSENELLEHRSQLPTFTVGGQVLPCLPNEPLCVSGSVALNGDL